MADDWHASLRWVWQQLRKDPPESLDRKSYRKIVFAIWRKGVHPAWAKSTLEFFLGHWLRWLWLVPGVFLGLLSLYGEATEKTSLQVDPVIVWIVIGVGFLIAALAEFHRIRMEREHLAENPQVALNKQLSEGHKIRDLMKPDAPKMDDPLLKLMKWNLGAENAVRDHAPAYYGEWKIKVQKYEVTDAVARFVHGVNCLEGICRKIGVRQP